MEASAIRVLSELTEDDVKVCVVLRPGWSLDPAGLHAYCADHAPKHMVPRDYEIVPALPKTPTQMVEKFLLRSAGVTGTTWDAERSRTASFGG